MIAYANPCSVPLSDDQFFMDLHFPRWCTLMSNGLQTKISVHLPFEFEGHRFWNDLKAFDARLHRLVQFLQGSGEALILHDLG